MYFTGQDVYLHEMLTGSSLSLPEYEPPPRVSLVLPHTSQWPQYEPPPKVDEIQVCRVQAFYYDLS